MSLSSSYKLWRPFATRPEMLRYRPQILLCRWLSKDHSTAMVEGFAEFYMGARRPGFFPASDPSIYCSPLRPYMGIRTSTKQRRRDTLASHGSRGRGEDQCASSRKRSLPRWRRWKEQRWILRLVAWKRWPEIRGRRSKAYDIYVDLDMIVRYSMDTLMSTVHDQIIIGWLSMHLGLRYFASSLYYIQHS
jgi:hypothetical protein